MANYHNKSLRRWLFPIKNLQSKLVGPTFDSGRGHPVVVSMSGLIKMIKSGFRISTPKFVDANLGIHEFPQKFIIQNFLMGLIHPELNFRCNRLFGKI